MSIKRFRCKNACVTSQKTIAIVNGRTYEYVLPRYEVYESLTYML